MRKENLKKHSSFNGIRTHDPAITGAVLNQVSLCCLLLLPSPGISVDISIETKTQAQGK